MRKLPLSLLAMLAYLLFPLSFATQAVVTALDPPARIASPTLSGDGRQVAYVLEQEVGDARLVIRSTLGDSQFALPLGGSNVAQALRFSADARQLVFACPPKDKRVEGDLCVLDIASRDLTRIQAVAAHALDSESRSLAYAIAKGPGAGVFVRRLEDGRVTTLLAGEGGHRNLVFDKAGERIAFLSDQGDAPGRFSLYLGSTTRSAARIVADADLRRSGERIAPEAQVGFAGAGQAICFGLVAAEPSQPAVAEGEAEVWHWRDPGKWWGQLPEGRWKPSAAVAPWQMPLPALYRIADRRWVRLGTPEQPFVLLGDGETALAVGGALPGRIINATRRVRNNEPADLYLLDPRSGRTTLHRRHIRATYRSKAYQAGMKVMNYFNLSPTERYLTWFEDRRWRALDLQTHREINLTGTLLGQADFGGQYPPSKIAGWTQGDREVLIYDRHDLWMVDPTGKRTPRNLTAGIGKRDNMVFRLWEDAWLIGDAVGSIGDSATREIEIDPARPLLLVAADLDTMASGVWRAHLDGRPLEKLMMLDKRITPLARAGHAEQYLLSIEDHDEYPDLWTGSRFDALRRLTQVDPEQSKTPRSRVELVSFTSELGVPLKGKLVKPPHFNPKRKYPMVVKIYTIQSDTFHHYAPPPGDSDYLLLYPDIYSVATHPGPSAYAAVMSAVQAVVDRGYVDEQRIALRGHSFGGYETSYILTRTDRFHCAINEAGSTNFVTYHGDYKSMYGPIFIEDGQAGMNTSPWKNLPNYIANSPSFHADKIKTPLLMMYNEADHATPLSQGLEFFFALQRNGKPVWLVSYPGEGHNLQRETNRLDWERKARAFLDHCLEDAPEPNWMKWSGTPSPFERSSVADKEGLRKSGGLGRAGL